MEYLGLSEDEVLALKKKFGKNLIFEKEKISLIKILFSQLKSYLLLILAIVAGISLFFWRIF
jgi:P-type Ca2+ transporter type 2C